MIVGATGAVVVVGGRVTTTRGGNVAGTVVVGTIRMSTGSVVVVDVVVVEDVDVDVVEDRGATAAADSIWADGVVVVGTTRLGSVDRTGPRLSLSVASLSSNATTTGGGSSATEGVTTAAPLVTAATPSIVRDTVVTAEAAGAARVLNGTVSRPSV
ncbi:MAG: hypothetical protein EX269_03175 [Acidimicrobiales bacterium]|nr:MAG: hypothetical protein EX269_03175 [Acidimicrobiales bacterium]